MSRTLPAEGTYLARRNSKIVIEETKDGAIMAAIPYSLCGGAAFSDIHRVCIFTTEKKDNAAMAKNIDSLKKVFGWDGLNYFDLELIEIPEGNEPEFELADCKHEDYMPPGASEAIQQFRPSWFNPLGGRNLTPLDDSARKRLIAKHASKLRALSGAGGAAKKAEPKQDELPQEENRNEEGDENPPPRRSNRPAAATARSSTQQEVWNALEKKHKPKDKAAKEKLAQSTMWAKVDELFGEKDPLSPQDWGQVAEALGV